MCTEKKKLTWRSWKEKLRKKSNEYDKMENEYLYDIYKQEWQKKKRRSKQKLKTIWKKKYFKIAIKNCRKIRIGFKLKLCIVKYI